MINSGFWRTLTGTAAIALIPSLLWSQQQPARPCADGGVYNQFDFWVGYWDVFNPQGQQAGTNRIEKTQGGCMLLENWTSVRGGTGTSMNFYNPVTEKWIQIWTDPQGTVIDVEGEFRDGAMSFEGTHYYPDGHTELYRMTFTPNEDGSVQQFIQQSRDDGESWYVWFNGRYVRQAGQG